MEVDRRDSRGFATANLMTPKNTGRRHRATRHQPTMIYAYDPAANQALHYNVHREGRGNGPL